MRSKLATINNMTPIEQSNLRPGSDTAMFIETSQVLQHSLFQNSPTMTRLLIWLLHETLAGRGDSVKSYTIAVEALGRPETFDSQQDSYPRVQTGRLRKALETYYSQHGPVGDKCVYLQPGSYKLRFAELDLAYPQLYRPLSRASLPLLGEEPYPYADRATGKPGMIELPTSLVILTSVGLLSLLVLAAIL